MSEYEDLMSFREKFFLEVYSKAGMPELVLGVIQEAAKKRKGRLLSLPGSEAVRIMLSDARRKLVGRE